MKALILLLVITTVSVVSLSPKEKDDVSMALSVQASKVLGGVINSDGIAATKYIAEGAIQFDDSTNELGNNIVESDCLQSPVDIEGIDIGGDENCL
jgi:hypothetical protein